MYASRAAIAAGHLAKSLVRRAPRHGRRPTENGRGITTRSPNLKKVDARHMLLRVIAGKPLEISYDAGVSGDVGRFISSSYDVNLRVVNECLRAGWLARAAVLHRFRESPRHTFRFTVTALGRSVAGIKPQGRGIPRRQPAPDYGVPGGRQANHENVNGR